MSTTQPASGTQPYQRRNPWIVDWKQDLLWFIAPPLVLVPAFALLMRRFPLEQLSLLVVTFGAVGHHLPGMLRAYGDAELFHRYRVRFIVAPVFLIAVCVFYSFFRPDALAIVIVSWGFWHSQAQVYGFLRIYDSKVGLTARRTAAIDRFLCLTWFAGGIVMSEGRVADFLGVYYQSGGPVVSAAAISTLQVAMWVLMACSGLMFVTHMAWNWTRGHRVSLVKLIALVLSIGFWWYCMVGIRKIVLGVALYEVFHDVQYLAIVWFFNRRRASAEQSAGWFTQFLFRPRMRFVILYICLILAYGACSLITRSLDRSVLQTVLTGLFAASGLLHFYYDGFIWRIRERETSQTLGVDSGAGQTRPLLNQTHRLRHVGLWIIFVTPLLIFSWTSSTKEVHSMVLESLPESAEAHYNVAFDLYKQGQYDLAQQHVLTSLGQNQNLAKAWRLRGEIVLAQNQPIEAVEHLIHAVRLEPLSAVAQFNLGSALIQSRRIPEGVAAYEEAIRLDSTFETTAYNNLGAAMLHAEAFQDAEAAFRRAIEADSKNVKAIQNLAATLHRRGKVDEAVALYRNLLQFQPGSTENYAALAKLFILEGDTKQAEIILGEFGQLSPRDPEYCSLLGMLRLQQHQLEPAEEAFERALTLASDYFPALYGLSEAKLERNQAAECMRMIESIRETRELSASEAQMLMGLQNRANQSMPEIP